MRLAREKLTQEEVSKMQIARDALTAYRQSLFPDSEENSRPMTDHQLFTMVQEMEAQLNQEDMGTAPSPPTVLSEQASQQALKAIPSTSKDRERGSQNLFSLRRFVRTLDCHFM